MVYFGVSSPTGRFGLLVLETLCRFVLWSLIFSIRLWIS